MPLTSLYNSWLLFPELNEGGQIHDPKELIFHSFSFSFSFQQPNRIPAEFELSGPQVPQWAPSSPNAQCILVRVEVDFCSSCEDGIHLKGGEMRGQGFA